MRRIKMACFVLALLFVFGRHMAKAPGAKGVSALNPTAALPQMPGGTSFIFVAENTDGTDDGFIRLLESMESAGMPFYQTTAQPRGMIAPNDVVLLEINCQWAERGGTNTDLIKSVIAAVLDHPDGFVGEIIVADNGQAQYGSAGKGGSLDWDDTNSLDGQQSALDVVNGFQGQGDRVSGILWDHFTRTRVEEFFDGNFQDGFVVEDVVRETGLEVSYPKFTTQYGTHVSFREGIWDEEKGAYDSGRLKVINMPVLKSHGLYQVTGAVKGYMGTTSDYLTSGRAHNSIGLGGMGTQMAYTRVPALNLMDMIWVGPTRGPGVRYDRAVQVNKIAASTDPIALDYWAAKYILMPAAEKIAGGRAASMDPSGDMPGAFGYWLRLSMDELRKAGYPVTMDESGIRVITAGSATGAQVAQ